MNLYNSRMKTKTHKTQLVFEKRGGEIDFSVWEISDKISADKNDIILSWQPHLGEWTDREANNSQTPCNHLDDGEKIATYIGTIIESIDIEIQDFQMGKIYDAILIDGIVSNPLIKIGDFVARLRN